MFLLYFLLIPLDSLIFSEKKKIFSLGDNFFGGNFKDNIDICYSYTTLFYTK